MWTEAACTAEAETLAALLRGGRVRLLDASGDVLTDHALGSPAVVGGTVHVPVEPAISTGVGTASRVELLSRTGQSLYLGAGVDLDDPDIDEGADVVLEPLRVLTGA